MAEFWNRNFTETVAEGAAGNQAYFAIFYRNGRGQFQRLYQAEGHEISKNPEKTTVNLIGQTAPKDIVKSFREEFSKDLVIEKGDANYEFFAEFARMGYTGKNAVVDILMVNMMENDKKEDEAHYKYLAYKYQATVTVDTMNYTDGKIGVSFSQATDTAQGIAQLVGDTEFPEFTPASDIAVSEINVSGDTVPVKKNKEAWVEVSFSPLGCPFDFTADVDETGKNICAAKRVRQSVVITGIGVGTTSVKIASTAAETVSKTISVTVSDD